MSEVQGPAQFRRKATWRLGQREMGRISLAVILVVVGALGFAGYRLTLSFKSQRDIVVAREHLLELWKAMHGYAQDWDGKLPPADTWTDSVAGYLSAPPNTPGGPMGYLHGPGDGQTVTYVYNDLASGYNLEPSGKAETRQIDPSRLVVLVERPGAAPNAHERIPPEDEEPEAFLRALSFPHNAEDPANATTVILYGDGHIEARPRSDFKR